MVETILAVLIPAFLTGILAFCAQQIKYARDDVKFYQNNAIGILEKQQVLLEDQQGLLMRQQKTLEELVERQDSKL